MENYCQTCDIYQRIGSKKKSYKIRQIIEFELWFIMGIDFLGPINPLEQNGEKYILIIINYFSKIVFIKVFQTANTKTMINF